MYLQQTQKVKLAGVEIHRRVNYFHLYTMQVTVILPYSRIIGCKKMIKNHQVSVRNAKLFIPKFTNSLHGNATEIMLMRMIPLTDLIV